jgi:hypothetical protein
MDNQNSFLNTNIKPILAIIIVVLGFGYFYMCSIRNIKPDPQILIAMVAAVAAATGYYFGSSQGSSKKDDALVSNVGNPTVTGDSPTVNVIPKPEQPVNTLTT